MDGTVPESTASSDALRLSRVRRRLRVRLIQDLVAAGRYRVPTDELAACLLARIDLGGTASQPPPG